MSIVKIRAALELAIQALEGIIPACPILSSSSGVFTTALPHKLVTNLNISISGHTVSNGVYLVTVLSATTFSLANKVTKQPIASGLSGTGGVVIANLTAWEGVAFTPVTGVPFQRVMLVPAAPENPSFGGQHSRELGFLQITLYYPVQEGTVDVMTRAELIRSTFKRGSTFSNSGITVTISKTPAILTAEPEDEFLIVGVRIPYWCDVFN